MNDLNLNQFTLIIITISTSLQLSRIATASPNGTYDLSKPRQTEIDYGRLKTDILNHPIVKYKIPPENVGGQGYLGMALYPNQIVKIKETDQIVSISVILYLKWYYPGLSWKAEDYGNHSQVYLNINQLWAPNIGIPESADNNIFSSTTEVMVHSSRFETFISQVLNIICKLDMAHFPFDAHNCTVIFIEKSGHTLDLVPRDRIRIGAFLPHEFRTTNEWIYMDSDCYVVIDPSGALPNSIHCWFTWKRRSFFYQMTFVSPVLVLAFVIPFVFLVPAESEQKVAYIITLFVSITIFIGLVISHIPRSLIELPKILLILATLTVKTLLCMLGSLVTTRRYHYHTRICQQKSEKKGTILMKDEKGVKTASKRASTDPICPEIEKIEVKPNDNNSVSDMGTNYYRTKADHSQHHNILSTTWKSIRASKKSETYKTNLIKFHQPLSKKMLSLIVGFYKIYKGASHRTLDIVFFFAIFISSSFVYVYILFK